MVKAVQGWQSYHLEIWKPKYSVTLRTCTDFALTFTEDDIWNYETNKNETVALQPVEQSVFKVRYPSYIVEWIAVAIPSQKFQTHIMSDSEYLRIYHYLNAKEMGINKQVHSFSILSDEGPKPPLKRFLHIVRSRVSSLKWEYPLLSLRSSSSFLRLFPRLPVTSISPFIFPSITCFRRQFLRKMWPIQLAFRFSACCGRPLPLERRKRGIKRRPRNSGVKQERINQTAKQFQGEKNPFSVTSESLG